LFTSKLSDALGGPMVGIVEKLAEMAEKGLRFGKTLTLLAKVSLGVFIAQIKVAKEVLGGFWQIAGKLQARDFTGALEEAGGALVKMKDVFAKDAWGDMKALWAALGEGVPALGGVEDGTLRVGSALDALLAKVPQLSTVGGAVGSAIGGGLAALNKAEKDNTKKGGGKKAAKAPDFGDKFSGLLGMGKQNQIDLDKQLNDQEAAAAQSKLDWAERLRMVETEEIARGFDRLDMLAKEKAARGALNSTMFSSAKAAAVGAAGAIQSERARAGVMAIVAAADAALAYSTGNIPGGITATFAALQYAKVALMSAPQVPSSSGSATSSTGSAATPSAANGGTGTNVTVVLQGGVLVGTVQELGNFVQGAVSSLNGTGLARGTA